MGRFDSLVANWRNHFEYVERPADADWAVLPADWKYYQRENKTELALQFLSKMKDENRRIFVQYNSDDDLPIPELSGAGSPWLSRTTVVRTSFFNSQQKPNEYVLPGFSGDPLPVFCNQVLPVREKSPKPKISFCGRANRTSMTSSQLNAFHSMVDSGFSGIELPEKYNHVYSFRGTVLNILESTGRLDTNFIARNDYCAGIDREKDQEGLARVRKEYYDSIFGSDYVLCIRGKGNYSYRFYEALSSGRIPVFVNTDSPLPFSDIVNWHGHCVWVDHREVQNITDIICSFHDRLSPADFRERQESNRALWERMLIPEKFFSILLRSLEK